MNLSEMSLTSLEVLLSTMPPNCTKEQEVKAEIEKRQASGRWKEANEGQVFQRLNEALKINQN